MLTLAHVSECVCVYSLNQLGASGVHQDLLTSDQPYSACFSQKCFDMANSGRPANLAKLAAYMDEKPENAMKRKKLTDKAAAYKEALQVRVSPHMHCTCTIAC